MSGARIPECRIEYPNVEQGADLGGHPLWTADVIVVGSGVGGATTAAALAAAGYDVLILEEGELHRTESFNTNPSEMIRRLYRDAGTSAIMGKPPILFAEGRCVGGSSVINGGMCWRTPDHVLEAWSEDHRLPETSPRAMARYFEAAEHILNVELQPEQTWGRHSRIFAEGAAKLGWEMEQNRRNMDHCVGLNNCALGCPTGAKRSMLVTEIPRALHCGARLITGAKVRKVRFSGRRAVGVRGVIVDERGRSLRRFDAYAPLVVLAAGARHTPGILLRSRVRSPALGRNLRTHPNAKVVGVFDEPLDTWVGAHQTHQLHKFLKEGILIAASTVPPGLLASGLPGLGPGHAERMRQYNQMITAAALIEDTGEGRVRLGPDREPLMTFKLSDRDVETIHRGVRMTARILFEAGAREVLLPFAHLPTISSADELEKIDTLKRNPAAIELMTVHIMGSARMSPHPAEGVTDSYGRVHDTEGLAIADASLFPSSVGVNPQETIMALALRNVEHLMRAIRREPRSRRDSV
ncbi:MAG: GMC family oxidoreductase [bacterium]|nr:GMC family oxidoreductase [bacterium]